MDSAEKKQQTAAKDDRQSPDSELKRRRERGRAAQAAFRKRQTDTIQSQEHQIQIFTRAFRSMSQARYRLKLAAQLSTTMGNGDIPASLINEIIGLLELANSEISEISLPDEDIAEGTDARQVGSSLRPERLTTGSNTGPKSQTSTDTEFSQPSHIEQPTAWNPLTATDVTSFSSRLKTQSGIQARSASAPTPSNKLYPPIAIRLPPTEVLPFLPQAPNGQQTFAGRLYWTTISTAFNLLSTQPDQVLRGYPMFEYHVRHHNYESLRRRVGLLLAIHRSGHLYEDANPEFSLRLVQMCTNDAAERGLPLERYLDAREVELHLRRKFIDPDNLHHNTLAGLVNQPTVDDITVSMLNQLSEKSVCLGDGPKYLIDDVDKVFDAVTGGILPSFEMDPQLRQIAY